MIADADQLVQGISISKSEVGFSSLRIAAFFLRLACTKGLIIKTQIAATYRHVSRSISQTRTMFHLVNAYTWAAHYPDLPAAARYHLQQVGGNILAMVK
ncbi:MAG: hypothetical protein JRI50_11355 [Deltaproteobacteria bacterium]|nr:hypothetical protein [Deltaproteobacteria bacterium]